MPIRPLPRPALWLLSWYQRRSAHCGQPVLNPQAIDAGEFADIVGDQREPGGQDVSGDQQVVRADDQAARVELGANIAEIAVGLRFQWEDFKRLKYRLQLRAQLG